MKKDKTNPEKEETTQPQETVPEQEETTESREDELQKALDETNDRFLRLAAEYDNFRRRSQKEKQDIYSSSKADIIKELLPVLDNFDRAANNSTASLEDYKKGIELIFEQFCSILKKNGVESFGAEGETFDPNIHNAVMSVEDDNFGENTVAQVFSKGYKLGDRIIREAVVKVANS